MIPKWMKRNSRKGKNKMEENKKENEEAKKSKDEVEVEDKKEVNPEIEKLKQQISFLEADNKKLKASEEQWKNKFYEAYADLANTRKSLEKDHQDMVRYRASGFIDKILPALDSFEMAFKVESKDPVVKNFAQGFKMILSQIEQGLKDEGVSFIEPKKGSQFDEKTMHAIQTQEAEEDNLVIDTLARGYILHDRLLRPAMVIVSKKKEAEVKEDEKKVTNEDKSSDNK